MQIDFSAIPLILLAGGKSARMGELKGLLRTRGKFWIERQIETFFQAGGKRTVVVFGHRSQEYFQALRDFRPQGVNFTVNPNPENGPFSSIQTGLKALFAEEPLPEAVFILPIDVPAPEAETWRSLARLRSPVVKACTPAFEGRGGHPVLLSGEFARELLNRPATSRLDEALAELGTGERLRVEVTDPHILRNLNTPADWENLSWDPILEMGKAAALLSAVEIGLGSFLHAFHVPLSGHFLSLNQSFLLSRSVARSKKQGAPSRGIPFTISNVSAVLKSLSPAGKKLTPMLAISAQGALFAMGTALLGGNLAGAMLGAALSSLWAFLQPLFIYYLLFGKTLLFVARQLFDMIHGVWAFPADAFVRVLVAVVAFKALVSAALSACAFLLPERFLRRYDERFARGALKNVKKHSAKSAARLALGDLFRPLFIFSLLLTGGFFWFSEAKAAMLVWVLLRPIAVGFLIFFLARAVSWGPVLTYLERKGFSRFTRALRIAVSG